MWCIALGIVAVATIYWLLIRPHRYWVEKGVQQGSFRHIAMDSLGAIFKLQSVPDTVEMVYKRCPNTRYSGFYQFFAPLLVLRDPDLIKQIAVKDFDHFVDHQTLIPEDADPLWAKNLFALTGTKWRDMRQTLSPAFTSSKMKYMFSLISEGGEQFVNYFVKKSEDLITIEMKDTFTRFTSDMIASTAFGVQCNSLSERDNEFFLMGKDVTDFSGLWKNLTLLGYLLMPRVFKHFKIGFFSKKVCHFFTGLVKSNIESREKHGIIRPDMINLLLEAKKNRLKHDDQQPEQDTGFATAKESEIGLVPRNEKISITDEDITAQALVFFFAGFDSVSSLMCFMSYELGINPDIQERLIQEVDETRESCKNKLTYEAILGMKYLDMVVSETLRKWPNNVFVNRACTKPYTIEPKEPGETSLHLEKNALLWIPIFALHRDPKYYPHPERFDPDRFSDENKEHIKPYTYLPFGCGPRNCIGSRFALLEAKVLIYYILSHFQIVPVENTQIPVVLSKRSFSLNAEDGFWFGLKRRV